MVSLYTYTTHRDFTGRGINGDLIMTESADATGVWADTPYPLIASTGLKEAGVPKSNYAYYITRTMAAVHNSFIRSINAQYNSAEGVEEIAKTQPAEVANFLFGCEANIEVLHHHHMAEESTFFPSLIEITGDPKFCDGESDQHRVFDSSVKDFENYIRSVKPQDFKAKTFKHLLKQFADPLQVHLTSELDMLIRIAPYEATSRAALRQGECKVCSSCNDRPRSDEVRLDLYYRLCRVLTDVRQQTILCCGRVPRRHL